LRRRRPAPAQFDQQRLLDAFGGQNFRPRDLVDARPRQQRGENLGAPRGFARTGRLVGGYPDLKEGVRAVSFDAAKSGGAKDAPFPLSHKMPRAA